MFQRKPDEPKVQLDEMQQQALSAVMVKSYSLCWVGLLAAILIQVTLTVDFALVAGEWLVFLVVNLYMLAGLLRAGIWSGKYRPDTKTNLIVSLCVGAFCFLWTGVIYALRLARDLPTVDFPWPLALGLLLGGGGLTFAALQLAAVLHRKRRRQLDEAEESE